MSVVKLTTAEFENVAAKSAKPVLIDFWASWCGPCRMLSPVIDEVSEERNDVLFCKVNVDEEPELAKKFGVMSIPTLVLLENGLQKAMVNIFALGEGNGNAKEFPIGFGHADFGAISRLCSHLADVLKPQLAGIAVNTHLIPDGQPEEGAAHGYGHHQDKQYQQFGVARKPAEKSFDFSFLFFHRFLRLHRLRLLVAHLFLLVHIFALRFEDFHNRVCKFRGGALSCFSIAFPLYQLPWSNATQKDKVCKIFSAIQKNRKTPDFSRIAKGWGSFPALLIFLLY